MARNEHTDYQKQVIKNYYSNLETITLQKLSELVTELYLAENQAKTDRLWLRSHKAMQKLRIPPAIINHIMQNKSVEILAKNLQDWLDTGKRK